MNGEIDGQGGGRTGGQFAASGIKGE